MMMAPPTGSPPTGAQQAIQGCIDAAIENGLDGFEFALFIQQCIDDLCKNQIIECEE